MSRGDQHVLDEPYRTWVVTVDDYHRVRLPIDVRTIVPWIPDKAGTMECVALPGAAGGLQIVPLQVYENDSRRFTEALGDRAARADEAQLPWVAAARLLASAWRLSMSIEAGRISITLSEPVRRAEQVPISGRPVVVFGFGHILEIWDAVKWHDHVRAIARGKPSVLLEATEDLRQR